MFDKTHKQLSQFLLVVSTLWLAAAVLLVVISRWLSLSWIFWLYLVVTLATSSISFAVFGIDKSRAKKDRWRISERSLHWLALLGGWAGAIVGREVFRHKTQKMAFRVSLPLFAAMHMLVLFLSIVFF